MLSLSHVPRTAARALCRRAAAAAPTLQIQGNVDREMAVAASLVAQGKKDRALLALKRKKLQARGTADRGLGDKASGRGVGPWATPLAHLPPLHASPMLPALQEGQLATLDAYLLNVEEMVGWAGGRGRGPAVSQSVPQHGSVMSISKRPAEARKDGRQWPCWLPLHRCVSSSETQWQSAVMALCVPR